jgi:hypothetical protein
VREVIELLLRARGEWEGILERYFAQTERTEKAEKGLRPAMAKRVET